MLDLKSLYIDGKEVESLDLNGSCVYSSRQAAASTVINNYAANTFGLLNPVKAGSASYQYNDQTIVYDYFNFGDNLVPPTQLYATDDSYRGDRFLWPIGNNLVMTATHWYLEPGLYKAAASSGGEQTIAVEKFETLEVIAGRNYGSGAEELLAKVQGYRDITIGTVANNTFAYGQIPYFMTDTTRRRIFTKTGNFAGTTAFIIPYKIPADQQKPLTPVVMTGDYSWATPAEAYHIVDDYMLRRAYEKYPTTYLAANGQSGLPVMFIDSHGRRIAVSHFTTPRTGPDYCAAYEYILKNVYPQLNEYTADMIN